MSKYLNGSTVSTCKKVEFDYELGPFKHEAGLVLSGSKVKEIRDMGLVLTGSRVWLKDNQAWFHQEVGEDIKLLLKRKEIEALTRYHLAGYSLLVDQCYITETGKIKIRVRVGKPKKNWDKRDAIKKRDLARRGDE